MAEISRLAGPGGRPVGLAATGSAVDARAPTCSSIRRVSGDRPGATVTPRPRRSAPTCPVLAQCRAHALQVREPYGVWGGMTEDEREAAYATGSPMPAA